MKYQRSNFDYPFIGSGIYCLGKLILIIYSLYIINYHAGYIFKSNINNDVGKWIVIEIFTTPLYFSIVFFLVFRANKLRIKPIFVVLIGLSFYCTSLFLIRKSQKILRYESDNSDILKDRAVNITNNLNQNLTFSQKRYDLVEVFNIIEKATIDLYVFTVISIFFQTIFVAPLIIILFKTKKLKLFEIVEDPRVIQFKSRQQLMDDLKKMKENKNAQPNKNKKKKD